MTREEAIEILGELWRYEKTDKYTDSQIREALEKAIEALKNRPIRECEKYCDRNICISNEYNGIGCDECEVTKSRER